MTGEYSMLRDAGTLPALLDRLAEGWPDRPAVTDATRTLSYGALRAEAVRLAAALRADGVRRGDMVGVLMGNRAEWIVSCFAAYCLGATVVAMNTWYTARELAYVLAHADIRVLITVRRFLRSDYVEMLETLRPWRTSLPALRTVVVLDDAWGENTPADGMIGWHAFLATGNGVADREIATAAGTVRFDDVALLLYTSGSTAAPKGVRLAHWGLIRNCFDIGERQGLTQDDVLFLPISLFWGFGCSNGMMAALTHAAHLVLQEHFVAGRAAELIERFRCTAIYGTANIMQAILGLPDLAARDLSSLRKGLTFGSPALMAEVIGKLVADICQVYGFTEGYGNSTVTEATDPAETRLWSSGRVLPGSELRIVDPAHETVLPPGQEGEIRVRGCIMSGYHKDPGGTLAAHDSDGFFRSGDLGVLDRDGRLCFRGRLKELIKTGGMNVSPAEVEAVLRSHPTISDAFVTGLADAEREEIVGALVVLQEGASFSAEELTRHCRAALSAFKVPRRIQPVDPTALPLTTTLKIHRARLGELFT